jgi:hypothetical protein
MQSANPDSMMTPHPHCRWLGVQHVYLTENSSGNFKEKARLLQPFVSARFLTLQQDRRPQAQLMVYHRCIRDHRSKHNWLAFFDIDEILIIREKCDPWLRAHN